MDQALIMKQKLDSGIILDDQTIDQFLTSSQLVLKLTSDFSKKSLFPIWRLIALSEIPYANRLPYTQELIEYVEQAYGTADGFSITGKSADILSCYTAMLLEAFVKLGAGDRLIVQSAVDWIINYQVFERNAKTNWTGSGILKYGGCMKATPCYIGIAKSVKALLYYSNIMKVHDKRIMELIEKGLDYLLQHQLHQRLSYQEPITSHILDIAYPQSYQLNIIELLEIAFIAGKMNHPAVKAAIEYVKSKRIKGNYWKIDYSYKADGFVSFDQRGREGDWVTYLLNMYFNQVDVDKSSDISHETDCI